MVFREVDSCLGVPNGCLLYVGCEVHMIGWSDARRNVTNEAWQ